jgi:hypothetical protein
LATNVLNSINNTIAKEKKEKNKKKKKNKNSNKKEFKITNQFINNLYIQN